MGKVRMTAGVAPAQATMEATILRCNCGAAPGTHFGADCPSPLRIPLGTIAYHHKNPLKRLLYRIYRRLNPTGTFWR